MHSAERPGPLAPAPGAMQVAGHERQDLTAGWRVAGCAVDACAAPADADGLEWIPAAVPGTAAGALRDAGRWQFGDERDFDAEDWWFRTEFKAAPAVAGERVLLRLDGVATFHEVFLNGEPVASGDSMFAAATIDVGSLLHDGDNELAIRCAALAGQLGARRKPRARWRTRLADNRLRFVRTMLLGRCPGFAPGPAAVGPWRPVWIERRRGLDVAALELRTRCEGDEGVLAIRLRGAMRDGAVVEAAEISLSGPGEVTSSLMSKTDDEGFQLSGEIRVSAVRRWWPHTHGEPTLYAAKLQISTGAGICAVDLGQVGFRDLAPGPDPGHDILEDGIALHVNGVPVFARGAVWTPVDFVGMAPGEERLRAALEQVRDAGMNTLRIPGTAAYESPAFLRLCDELGILVWQDFMFANFDYPLGDEDFRAAVEAEVEAQLAVLGGHPSLAVVCGNSEVEQQVAMLGLDPELGRGELFGELLPAALDAAAVEAIYVPSAPSGGPLPFRPDRGVANYYGVGGYRRPLSDVRTSRVRFAAECLAFANVPDPDGVEAILPETPLDVVVHHPRWKAGVPRDVGTGWDFDDVRDHYLGELYGVDAAELRRYDHERYLELSRAVSAEAMSVVFGEWRRGASPCGGGLVLWLRDLVPGAGWGLIDHGGAPKEAYRALRRALAPTAVWLTDEGLGGIGVHVANDRAEPLSATLRVALYADASREVATAREEVRLGAHTTVSQDLEAMLGRFVDASWAYRFGPPAQDVIVATLEAPDDAAPVISQATIFPVERPTLAELPQDLGIEGELRSGAAGPELLLRARRFVHQVRLTGRFPEASHAAFSLEPGVDRVLPVGTFRGDAAATVAVTALNMRGRLLVQP